MDSVEFGANVDEIVVVVAVVVVAVVVVVVVLGQCDDKELVVVVVVVVVGVGVESKFDMVDEVAAVFEDLKEEDLIHD